MNILFISLININNIDGHDIYLDLIRSLAKRDNNITIISPVERRYKEKSRIINFDYYNDWHKNITILKVKTGNIQKTNIIEKGISTFLFEWQIVRAIKKYLKKTKFDLILYPTPPITLVKAVKFVKKRDNARTYLMLKDIFPQNAVDLGMLNKNGLKGIIYKMFRKKEVLLYSISDKIGCMSQANKEYLLANNPYITDNKVELFPNCIEPLQFSITEEDKVNLRKKYNLPLDKKVFVYGGNLGKPQGISFIIDCLRTLKNNDEVFFLIIGDGTEYSLLENYEKEECPNNFKLYKRIDKNEYDKMILSCDVGLIFLDHRFTIPNFPSRLLSYMQAGLPILASTDTVSDVGETIENGGFGLWCESNNVKEFVNKVDLMCKFSNNVDIKNKELQYLYDNFTVDNVIENSSLLKKY